MTLDPASETVKLACAVPASPSVTDTLSIATGGSGSLSVMLPTPWPSATVALIGAVRFTVKLSGFSAESSPTTGTLMSFVVSPAANVSVPLRDE